MAECVKVATTFCGTQVSEKVHKFKHTEYQCLLIVECESASRCFKQQKEDDGRCLLF